MLETFSAWPAVWQAFAATVFTWGLTALGAVFLSGVLFLILSVTKIREWIVDAIPMSQKFAISAGIGLFLGIIALVIFLIVRAASKFQKAPAATTKATTPSTVTTAASARSNGSNASSSGHCCHAGGPPPSKSKISRPPG